MAEISYPASFVPTKTIVLAELPIREKEIYYKLMLMNGSKFRKDSQGRYVTNVRLLGPNERLRKLKEQGFVTVKIIGNDIDTQFDYSAYPRFTSLIAFNGDEIKPKLRPLSWVMKLIEDIYDARFSHEKNEVEREEDSPSYDLMLLIFPVFVVRRLGTNVGLKTIVDQTCWDLLYNTHIYRRDHLELEVFARFIQEFYDHDDLLFYLYVRSVIAKVLHINFKSRWGVNKSEHGPGRQPKSMWISYRESSHVARIVFGTENEGMYRDFMNLIAPQMVGQRTDTTDSRRIDVTEFLHLSVIGYHQSQSRAQGISAGPRELIPIPGQTAPIPATKQTFNNRFDANEPHHTNDQEDEKYEEGGEYFNDGVEYYDDMDAQNEHGDENAHNNNQYLDDDDVDYAYNQNRMHLNNDAEFDLEEQEFAAEYNKRGGNNNNNNVDSSIDRMLQGLHVEDAFTKNNKGSKTSNAKPTINNPEYNTAGSRAQKDINLRTFDQDVSSPILAPADPHGDPDNDHTMFNDNVAFDRSMLNASSTTPGNKNGTKGTEANPAAGASQEAEAMNEFELLQSQREQEFMAYLCGELSDHLPEEQCQYIEGDIAERLHQTVNILLADKDISDLDSLDECLVEILQLDDLRVDMEAVRDELIQHFMQQNQEAAEEEAQLQRNQK